MKQSMRYSIVALWVATASHAAVINAASCSDANVQAAINSAAAGDTVNVPSGACTWTSTVTISNKGITLTGAGVGQTNITDQGSRGAALDISGASATNFVTVYGFTFIKSTDHSSGIVQVDGTRFDVAFRIHHIQIVHGSSGSRGIKTVNVYGLIDHVSFEASSGSVQNVSIYGSSDGSDGGFSPWTQPLTLGTNKGVYVEDSTFTYATGAQTEDAIDAYGGARLVLRHNTFTSITVGFHGFDSGDRRSAFSYEIYNNAFTNNSTTTLRAATLRGGTGVIYSNTYNGSHAWNGITAMVYRACPTLDQSAWGTCNGTLWEIGSTNFSAQASRTSSTNGGVNFCSGDRDLVCTADSTCSSAGKGTCTTYVDGSGAAGYPCRDQVGMTRGQVLSPLYAWDNGSIKIGTYAGGFSCGVGLSNYLQPGRDYIEGVAMPGYSAYTYPHPLQGQSSAPAPPSSLTVSVR